MKGAWRDPVEDPRWAAFLSRICWQECAEDPRWAAQYIKELEIRLATAEQLLNEISFEFMQDAARVRAAEATGVARWLQRVIDWKASLLQGVARRRSVRGGQVPFDKRRT